MTSHIKIAQFNCGCIGRLKSIQHVAVPCKHPLKMYLAVSWFIRLDAAADKSTIAVKSKEIKALLNDIDSAIRSKQNYTAYQHVQK